MQGTDSTTPSPPSATIHLNAGLDIVRRADKIASHLTRTGAGVEVPRASVYRKALALGLDAIERELGSAAAEGAAA